MHFLFIPGIADDRWVIDPGSASSTASPTTGMGGNRSLAPRVLISIQAYAFAMQAEVTEHELTETVFPHPTLSEMLHEAVLDAYDRVSHI